MDHPPIKGFDSDGEPELRDGENGALEIMFNFMPPLNGQTDPNMHPIFDKFETLLALALQVEVLRDDRELFIIPKPRPDTAGRAKLFLDSFWTVTWPSLAKRTP
jgi:hypothetical protein